MSLEIEAKLRVEAHEPVRSRLKELGADFLSKGLETNWIYDLPDGSLRARGCGLRLRSFVSDADDGPTATLTLKGPRQPGEFKSREELEVTVSSGDTASAMLEMLGYRVVLGYQKRRESWSLGSCRVELDEPPHLGLFVEIEGPEISTIRAVQDDLGLGQLPHAGDSYVGLLLSHCRKHGLSPLDLMLA